MDNIGLQGRKTGAMLDHVVLSCFQLSLPSDGVSPKGNDGNASTWASHTFYFTSFVVSSVAKHILGVDPDVFLRAGPRIGACIRISHQLVPENTRVNLIVIDNRLHLRLTTLFNPRLHSNLNMRDVPNDNGS
jgi:hypothetical protein